MENYFASQRHNIFRNVEVETIILHATISWDADYVLQVLIYVFDVQSRELEKDFHYYQSCLSSIAEVN